MCNRDSSSASISKENSRFLRPAESLLAALTIAGCASVESTAPPVPVGSRDATMLAEGRRVFLHQCIACHSAEPVGKYTRTRWMEIVSEMTGDANLTAQQERALRAYLTAVAR